MLVVRHSQSTFNKEGRWAGWLDPPLTPAGVAAAERAAERWRGHDLERVCSSDLQRASSGAAILAERLGLPLGPALAGLRERNAGRWQGELLVDLNDDPRYDRWVHDQEVTPPDGEPYSEFTARLVAAVGLLLRDDVRQLAVTHDGVVTGLCHALALPRPPIRPLVDAIEITAGRDGHLVGAILLAEEEPAR